MNNNPLYKGLNDPGILSMSDYTKMYERNYYAAHILLHYTTHPHGAEQIGDPLTPRSGAMVPTEYSPPFRTPSDQTSLPHG